MIKPTIDQLRYTCLITELHGHIQDLDLLNKIIDKSEQKAQQELEEYE